MINVSEARKLIAVNCGIPKIETVELIEANGCILSEDVYSVLDTPSFNQSAMDGYAFSFDSLHGKKIFNVKGEIQTGNYSSEPLTALETVRIYTGAPLPPGADTVVMQEKVIRNGDTIIVTDEQLVKGSNVRLLGSQTKKGESALKQGQLITPAGISFLAGLGITKVNVFSKPAVSIIVTGKELVKPGNEISEGQIFESNSFGLAAGLMQLSITPVAVKSTDDDEEEIKNTITGQLHNDIIILTGGVSVGDYDYVPEALEKCGVTKIFHKVKQKPGKPFYFGRHKQTLVFALPGNPAAVMSCFYEYIVPAISSYTKKNYFKKSILPLADNYHKNPGLTLFLKGKTGEQSVSILKNQQSYLMDSFAVADCLVELDEETEHFSKGDPVNISMII